MSIYSVPNQLGENPDTVHLRPVAIDTGQEQYDDLPNDAPQGRHESPSHYFDRISRQDPKND